MTPEELRRVLERQSLASLPLLAALDRAVGGVGQDDVVDRDPPTHAGGNGRPIRLAFRGLDVRRRRFHDSESLMRSDLPTGAVTFLFTDVEGSTRLLEEIGDEAYEEALSVHRRIVRAACQAHEGVEVDTQGDAFFFAFPEPPGALAAAQQMSEGLAAGPIQVRIGLHTGTPRLGEEGYVGSDVHFGARVAACAHGGQVVLSQATRDLVDGFVLSDLGEHRLKDIEHAVAIFQLGEKSFPPLKTISNTNLPRPASSFVGREQELEVVLALIEEGARLVTMTGPGGSGKTRLSLEAASTLVPEYKAGVFWVGLAALRDPSLVTEQIAQTLGAKDGLAEHIGEREMLLLLDNLEQVVEAAPDLSSLLSACPNLTLLVTSRELLRVQGEVEYPVPPLAEPEAVALFCERSQLSPTDQIAELCARLDSLPLAVELAAARTKALTPEQILDRLSQRLDLLKGGRDADPRQQTLRATIEWSYELLSEAEQQLFSRLSVFAGGCTLEAAEVVAEANLEILQSLVEKSLLRFSDGRYWMLETIREYARERLAESGEARSVEAQHADCFLRLALRAESYLQGLTLGAWLEKLEADHAELRAAVEWHLAGERPEAALEMAIALGRYLEARSHFTDGRRWLSEALARQPDAEPLIRARATYILARLVDSQAEFATAARLYDEARSLYAELGYARGVTEATIELTWAILQQGDVRQAERMGAEGLALARKLDDSAVVSNALVNHAATLVELGRYPEAMECYEESLARRRTLNEPRAIAISIASIGWTSFLAGDYARAMTASAEALDLFRRNSDRQWVANTLHTLGAVALAEGDLARASLLFAEALEEATETGDRRTAAECLVGLAAVAAERRDDDLAARVLGAADAMFAATGVVASPLVGSIRAHQIARATDRVGRERWENALASGHSLSPEEVVAYFSTASYGGR
jgi:predicted ATPase/class 3 adenylate cyclase